MLGISRSAVAVLVGGNSLFGGRTVVLNYMALSEMRVQLFLYIGGIEVLLVMQMSN